MITSAAEQGEHDGELNPGCGALHPSRGKLANPRAGLEEGPVDRCPWHCRSPHAGQGDAEDSARQLRRCRRQVMPAADPRGRHRLSAVLVAALAEGLG